jgi:hypothetical protein
MRRDATEEAVLQDADEMVFAHGDGIERKRQLRDLSATHESRLDGEQRSWGSGRRPKSKIEPMAGKILPSFRGFSSPLVLNSLTPRPAEME